VFICSYAFNLSQENDDFSIPTDEDIADYHAYDVEDNSPITAIASFQKQMEKFSEKYLENRQTLLSSLRRKLHKEERMKAFGKQEALVVIHNDPNQFIILISYAIRSLTEHRYPISSRTPLPDFNLNACTRSTTESLLAV